MNNNYTFMRWTDDISTFLFKHYRDMRAWGTKEGCNGKNCRVCCFGDMWEQDDDNKEEQDDSIRC